MRYLHYLLLLCLFALGATSGAAAEEPCVRRDVQLSCAVVTQAAASAMGSIQDSNRLGRTVDTSVQIIAEHDRICAVAFFWPDLQAQQMRIANHWCVRQEGAYDLRAAGISQRRVDELLNYLSRIRNHPDSWRLFERDVLGDVGRFATLQRLIRSGYREDLIRLLMLRRDVVFFGQNHPDGTLSN
jgi:hypothetical protein